VRPVCGALGGAPILVRPTILANAATRITIPGFGLPEAGFRAAGSVSLAGDAVC